MKPIVLNLIYFVGGYIVVFLSYLVFMKKKKKDAKKNKYSIEVNYLITKFNLDLKKNSLNKLFYISAFVNSFIISFTFMIIMNIDKTFIKLLVGFAILLILIYSLYEITGRSLKRKENKK